MSQPSPRRQYTNAQTLLFIVILSFVCALVLSVLSSALEKPKERARELDRSKQMMIAARMLSHEEFFLVKDKDGKVVPAKYEAGGHLVPDPAKVKATAQEILDVYAKRLIPRLVDRQGNVSDFSKEGIDEITYLAKNRKEGYSTLKEKLIYEILPNEKGQKPVGYVIPINGYGLWDAIYGYLAVETDGDTVIGISWYDQKETPGLGANIADAPWQNQFSGKLLFQEGPSGETDFKTAPLGITVVKGKVVEVLGNSPKANSAVDGIAGATLTGNGVTEAYKDVLVAYRPFLLKLHRESKG